jgi:hypothetical protein
MSGSEKPLFKFFVYIVESPSAADIYHNRSEGTLVAQAVALNQIPCVSRTAIDRTAFTAALRIGLPEAMKAYPALLPIVHFSAHGASDGLGLSNGDLVTWADLKDLIAPINASLNGTLIVCMSACEGYSACRMAMHLGDAPHPYMAIVANFGKPTWADTSVAYLTFYHRISKDLLVTEAVEAMKAASGDDQWVVETAAESKQAYLDFVSKQQDTTEARKELESVAEDEQLPAGAKALESAGGG